MSDSKWQPIETAPAKSPKLVMVWDAVVSRPRIIRGDDLDDRHQAVWAKDFTHWMPLPNAPTGDE